MARSWVNTVFSVWAPNELLHYHIKPGIEVLISISRPHPLPYRETWACSILLYYGTNWKSKEYEQSSSISNSYTVAHTMSPRAVSNSGQAMTDPSHITPGYHCISLLFDKVLITRAGSLEHGARRLLHCNRTGACDWWNKRCRLTCWWTQDCDTVS